MSDQGRLFLAELKWAAQFYARCCDREFALKTKSVLARINGAMEIQNDAEQAVENLHKIISQTETGLQLMRAEVERLKRFIEPTVPYAETSIRLTTSSTVQA
jgi:hypothetical protein